MRVLFITVVFAVLAIVSFADAQATDRPLPEAEARLAAITIKRALDINPKAFDKALDKEIQKELRGQKGEDLNLIFTPQEKRKYLSCFKNEMTSIYRENEVPEIVNILTTFSMTELGTMMDEKCTKLVAPELYDSIKDVINSSTKTPRKRS